MKGIRISYEIGDVIVYKGEVGEISSRSLFEGYEVKLDNGSIIKNVDHKDLETLHPL